MYEGFYSSTTNPDTVRAKLNSRVKRFIEHELLSKEGFNRNYQQMELPQNKQGIGQQHINLHTPMKQKLFQFPLLIYWNY